MDMAEYQRILREAEAKLAAIQGGAGPAEPLTPREQTVLLADLLVRQPTRQERRYGQP